MPRRTLWTTGLVGAVVIAAGGPVAASAQAAAVTVDHPCQVVGFTLTATLTGFTPNSTVSVKGDQVSVTGVADAARDRAAVVKAPLLGTADPKSKGFTITASDDAPDPVTATTTFRSATFAFGTSNAQQSPSAKRTWSFSGFPPGKPIYGHFRYNGTTRANYRFGVAKGVCGELTVRAPGIPAKGRINTGKWTVQIDQKAVFNRFTKPRLLGSVLVSVVLS